MGTYIYLHLVDFYDNMYIGKYTVLPMDPIPPGNRISKSETTSSRKAKLCRQHIYNIRMIPGQPPFLEGGPGGGMIFFGDLM